MPAPNSAKSNSAVFDAKKEEFRRYLESEGVISLLSRVLIDLHDESVKPENALAYIQNKLSDSNSLLEEIKNLKKENEVLKGKIAELRVMVEAISDKQKINKKEDNVVTKDKSENGLDELSEKNMEVDVLPTNTVVNEKESCEGKTAEKVVEKVKDTTETQTVVNDEPIKDVRLEKSTIVVSEDAETSSTKPVDDDIAEMNDVVVDREEKRPTNVEMEVVTASSSEFSNDDESKKMKSSDTNGSRDDVIQNVNENGIVDNVSIETEDDKKYGEESAKKHLQNDALMCESDDTLSSKISPSNGSISSSDQAFTENQSESKTDETTSMTE